VQISCPNFPALCSPGGDFFDLSFLCGRGRRARPISGDRWPPSNLGDIQPDHWPAEYTTELLNVLHVLAL